METPGLLGFTTKGVRKGTYNRLDSYPEALGDAVIKFILSPTDEELDEMILKIENLEWIPAHEEIKSLDYGRRGEGLRYFHMPSFSDMVHHYPTPDQIQSFKIENPDLASQFDDEEIELRYLPHPPDHAIIMAQQRLHWIPACDELIEVGYQLELLDRIWDGRQRHVVDDTDLAADGIMYEYVYWVDFENKLIEVTGVVDGPLTMSFKNLKIGILAEKYQEYWKKVEEEIAVRSRDRESKMGIPDTDLANLSLAQEKDGAEDLKEAEGQTFNVNVQEVGGSVKGETVEGAES